MEINTVKPSLSQAISSRANYLIKRQGVVSENIANADTPKYISRDIDFKASLNKATMKMATTNGFHINGAKGTSQIAYTEDTTHMRHDGNSVKMDIEMLKLSEIQMDYRLLTKVKAKLASFQKIAIGKGR